MRTFLNPEMALLKKWGIPGLFMFHSFQANFTQQLLATSAGLKLGLLDLKVIMLTI